ncbi:MAG: imidazole glycerol phosphate synthase subunit HisH [Gammaproteobacteria bacterium]|nr:imidazole glycerol phosphate synthase subunit HisH [Gammaproteobacteria bacterium]
MSVAIIDSCIANVGSVANMCKKIGQKSVVITNKPDEIRRAKRIILPGVGHYSKAVEQLDRLELRSVLNETVMQNKTPILGICLGMQLLGTGSEEGAGKGLGWIDGYCRRFRERSFEGLKIPHMGWNYVTTVSKDNPIAQFSSPNPKFYHVHSYHMETAPENVLFTTNYGCEFVSGIHRGHIWGVQFHPEKSHVFGMELLTNFCSIQKPE